MYKLCSKTVGWPHNPQLLTLGSSMWKTDINIQIIMKEKHFEYYLDLHTEVAIVSALLVLWAVVSFLKCVVLKRHSSFISIYVFSFAVW